MATGTIEKANTTTTQYLTTGEGKIAYTRVGSGPVVICIPSMGDVREEYRFLAAQLVAAGYTAVAMDVRGHGESSTHWNDFTVAGVGGDIIALARHLDAGPALVVGTSMAAGAAVYAATEAPDLIAGLVLVGPFVRDIPGPGYMQLLYRALFAKPWGPWAWTKYYRTLYPTNKPADFEGYVAQLKANLAEPGRLAALKKMILASKAASEERLNRVKTPVMVLMGTKDPDFKDPAAEAKLVADRLHAELYMVEGAGHYPHAEMPEQVGPTIIDFLNKVKSHEGAISL